MTDSVSGPGLRELLARWTAEGLIDAGQAARIAAAEAARGESSSAPGSADQAAAERQLSDRTARRFPLIVEALGYVGGALAIVAGFGVIPVLWPGIHTSAELAIAAVTAVGSWAAGALLRIGDEPAFRRLRAVLWLLSTASIAVFVGLIAAQVFQVGPTSTVLAASAVTAWYAGLLWWRSRTPIQLVATFAATAVAIGAGVARLWPDTHAWGPGLAVWGLSLLWGAASHRGYLIPLAAGYIAAGTGLLVGAQLTMGTAAGQALALSTVAGLIAAAVVLRRVLLLGFGALGIMVMVPQTATRYLPTSAGVPLAVFVVGLTLVALAVWLTKSRKRPPSP
jgi:hypothetical protein